MGSKKDDADVLGWLLILAVFAVVAAFFLWDKIKDVGGW